MKLSLWRLTAFLIIPIGALLLVGATSLDSLPGLRDIVDAVRNKEPQDAEPAEETNRPEIEGLQPWEFLCYPSLEAFAKDAEDNELHPPEESCAAADQVVPPDSGLTFDRTGPICIDNPETPPTAACAEPTAKPGTPEALP